jgi:hypothetical protein
MPVEVAPLRGRADDRVQAYRLQTQVPLAAPADRGGDLIEPQEAVNAMGLVAQAMGQRGQDLAAPGPQKVILGICLRESGI